MIITVRDVIYFLVPIAQWYDRRHQTHPITKKHITDICLLVYRLGASNSSINPILYCYMNKKFRISFMVSYLTVHQNYQFHVWCSRFCFVYSNRISWLDVRYDFKTIWQCIRCVAKATTKSTNLIIVLAPCLHAFRQQVAMNSDQKFKACNCFHLQFMWLKCW